MVNRRHLINVHSSKIDKVPVVSTADMHYGELAVNHFKGKAFISTRVAENEMEIFPSVHYIEQYPFSSLTVNNSTTLNGTTKINKIEAGSGTFDDNLSETSLNAVQNKVITKVIQNNEKVVSSSLNELNDRKLDASAYTPTDLSNYYKKSETSGNTELNTAFGQKANATALTAHMGDTTVHITEAERTRWNDLSASTHTHANKAVLDKITAIDTELSLTSNNLVVNSAITKVIADNEKTVSSSLNELNDRKLDASAYTPTDLSNYYKNSETSGKTELNTAFEQKANATALTAHIGDSTAHITEAERTRWNDLSASTHTHANKAVLDKIEAIDTELSLTSGNLVVNSAITKVIADNKKTISSSLNELNDRKLDASAYTPTDLSGYYKKSETSGNTELNTAFNSKANATALTTHIGDSTAHITEAERNKWNGLSASVHTHANKAVLDSITAIDTELSATSNNLVVNSAITKVITDNEKAISASLNELNDRKLDASAYTPTDLSGYYKKSETSGNTELNTAFNSKANASDLTTHTGNSTIHITEDERTKWNNASTIDAALSLTSSNPVANSAITTTIQENEEAISAALNDLNDRLRIIEKKLGLTTT